MPLALSTSWNASGHTSGSKMLFEIKGLGFEEVELSFNLTSSMVEEISELTRAKEIKVISVHNFCPVPEGVEREIALPDYFSLSSTDEQQRRKAVKHTENTIDAACRLGASCVVVHAGRVEVADHTRELTGLYNRGKAGSGGFALIKGKAVEERRKFAGKFLSAALKSLEELESYSSKNSLKLGIENRFYYREIPSFDEIGLILGHFKGSCLGYWHDTGHAQIMEKLGFAVHQDYLDKYLSQAIGVHLHDVSGCQDHLPPGRGEFDFSRLKPNLNRKTLKVTEIHHPASAEDIKEGRNFLARVFDEKY